MTRGKERMPMRARIRSGAAKKTERMRCVVVGRIVVMALSWMVRGNTDWVFMVEAENTVM